MTDDQRKHFYFPIWKRIKEKTDWQMCDGRLMANLAAQKVALNNFPDHAATAMAAILNAAESIAARARRAVESEDLRHACNRLVSGGRTDSSQRFNRSNLNHFDRLSAIIADPWDMNAMIAWENPAEDDRKRTVTYLKKIANDGRLIAISLNAWGVQDWETLDQSRLDALIAEVKNKAWQKYPRASRPATETANRPF